MQTIIDDSHVLVGDDRRELESDFPQKQQAYFGV